MKLSDAINGFLIDREGNKRGDLSPQTIRLYRYLLRRACDALNNPDISAITHAHLASFLDQLDDGTLSSSAQDNYWKAIRSFFSWSATTLKTEPIHAKLKRPIVIAEPVLPYSHADIKRIFTALESVTRTCRTSRKPYAQSRPTVTRDRAIISVLLDTGLRIGEITRVQTDDLMMDYSLIKVRPYHSSKKSRPRDVPFGKATKKALWHYLATRKDDSPLLFGLTQRGMQSLMRRIGERSGVDVHAHRFRHTFAIEYLRNGGDIYTLKYILGHSNLTMCMRYLAILNSDASNSHAKASPVDNWL